MSELWALPESPYSGNERKGKKGIPWRGPFMGSGWGSEVGPRPGAPRRMECRDDPGEWIGEEAGCR